MGALDSHKLGTVSHRQFHHSRHSHDPQSPPSELSPRSRTDSPDEGESRGRKRTSSGTSLSMEKRSANKICRVCGDKAFSYNFNVITCESCKAFFRRNANKEKEIRCPFNEACEINVVSRRFCQRCRLFKCFQVGMKKEWIMTDEARLEKKQRVEENRERRREEAKKKEFEAAAKTIVEQFEQIEQKMPPAAMLTSADHLPSVSSLPSTSTLLDVLSDVASLPPSSLPPTAFLPPPPVPSASLPVVPDPVSVPVVDAPLQAVARAIAIEQQLQQQQQQLVAAVAQIAVSQQPAFTGASLVDTTSSLVAPPPLLSSHPLIEQAAIVESLGLSVAPLPVASLPPPPPSAVAAVAAVEVAQQVVESVASQDTLLPQATLPTISAMQTQLMEVHRTPPETCCCSCSCGKYPGGRTIVEQAREEWEDEERRRSTSMKREEVELSDLLPSESSTISWLNPIVNTNPLTEAMISNAPLQPVKMPKSEAKFNVPQHDIYSSTHEMKNTLYRVTRNSSRQPLWSTCEESEFGNLEMDDEVTLKELHKVNEVWSAPFDAHDTRSNHKYDPSPSSKIMVAAIKRLIGMGRRIPALRALQQMDRFRLIRACYLDLLVLRGAMSYDPNENAFKGARNGFHVMLTDGDSTTSHENMHNKSVRLYSMFKEEYRQNESIMLLLAQITLFDPSVDGLVAVEAVRAERNKYKKCLKRLLWTLLDHEEPRAQIEYRTLMERLATVRRLNTGTRGCMAKQVGKYEPLIKELLGIH